MALTLEGLVADVKQIDRLGTLWQAVLEFVHARGIKMVSYHYDTGPFRGEVRPGVVADGFPQDWVCRYIEGDLSKVDPIPDLAAKLVHPFRWSEAGSLMALSPAQKQYTDMMAASNLGDGLAMQVYGPKTRNAYVGMGFGQAAPDLDGAAIFELQCAAQIGHIRFCQITDKRRDAAELSPRELEVLDWIARGKSNTVIADILGISRHTVDTMTRRMFEKLDVNDRVSAAVRGIGSGLVSY